MRLDKNNDVNEVLEDDVVETTKTSPEQKVTISDAKILLNSRSNCSAFVAILLS